MQPLGILVIGAIALAWIYAEGKKRPKASTTPEPEGTQGKDSSVSYWEGARPGMPRGLLAALVKALNPAMENKRDGGLTLMKHQFAFEENVKLMHTGEKSLWFSRNANLLYSDLRNPAINLQIASFSLAESYAEARKDIRDTYLAEARKRGLGAAIADAWYRAYAGGRA